MIMAMENVLAGWRVVITRAEGQSDGLAQRLRALGAEPLFFPTIAFAPPEDSDALDGAITRLTLGDFDWLVLTSANAVRCLAERLSQLSIAQNLKLPTSMRVAAVGPATAAACKALIGAEPAVVPEKFVAEALADALGDLHNQSVLLLNADLARPILEQQLRKIAALVQRVVAYRTVPASEGINLVPLLHDGQIDAITFASGSAARFFVARIGPEALEDARRAAIVCIGPVTAEEARAVGLPPTVTATTATEEGLVAALVAHVMSDA